MTREMVQPEQQIAFPVRRNAIRPEQGLPTLPRKEAVEGTKEFIHYLIENNPQRAAELQPLLELAVPVEQQLKEQAKRDADEAKIKEALQQKDDEIARLKEILSGNKRIGRRKFLSIAGKSLAIAGAASLVSGGIGELIYQQHSPEATARKAREQAQKDQAEKERAQNERKALEENGFLGTKLSIASERNWAIHYEAKQDDIVFRADPKHPEENFVMNSGTEIKLPSRTYDGKGNLQYWDTAIWLMDYETLNGSHIPELRVQYTREAGWTSKYPAERHLLGSNDTQLDTRAVAFTDIYTNETRYASFERIEAVPVKYRVRILDRIATTK